LILYADTSALVKLVVDEEGTHAVAEARATVRGAVSIVLGWAELCGALAALSQSSRLSGRNLTRASAAMSDLWTATAWIVTSVELARDAGDLARRHGLRGADAIHLASAALIAAREPTLFACWDQRLAAAAKREGLEVLSQD
jgi:predicted nucleic acid-binding protein